MTTRTTNMLRLGVGAIACFALASAVQAQQTPQAQRTPGPSKIQELPNCVSVNQQLTLRLNGGSPSVVPTADPIWTVTLPTPTTPFSTTPVSVWLTPFGGILGPTHWIQPNPSGNPVNFPPQTYVYSAQFHTPVDPYFYNSIMLTGRVAGDNKVIVKLNGVQIAQCLNINTCFKTATPFSASLSAFNRVGSAPFLNTLTVEVTNSPLGVSGPSKSGLLVQAQVVAICSKCTSPVPPPEPPCGGNPSTC